MESKELSLVSAPETFRTSNILHSVPWILEISKSIEQLKIYVPFDSSGASKEMPRNTHIIPSINIVVLKASNTCFQEDKVYMIPKFIIKTHSAIIEVMIQTYTPQNI